LNEGTSPAAGGASAGSSGAAGPQAPTGGSGDAGGAYAAGGGTGAAGGVHAAGGDGGNAVGVLVAGGSAGEGGVEGVVEPPCLDVESEFFESFDSVPDLGCWGFLNPDKVASLAGDPVLGVLQVVPDQESAWASGKAGSLLYRAVVGDFIAETRVAVRNSAGAPRAGARWSGGGLVVFNPASANQHFPHYYKVDVGSGNSLSDNGVKAEYFNVLPPRIVVRDERQSESSARLRICRVGGVVTLAYAAYDSDAWVAFPAYDPALPELPDVPGRVFVGLTASQYGTADPSRVDFDYFRIRQGAFDPIDCTASYP